MKQFFSSLQRKGFASSFAKPSPDPKTRNAEAMTAYFRREKNLLSMIQSLPGAVYRGSLGSFFALEFVSEKIEEITGFGFGKHFDPEFWSLLVHEEDAGRVHQARMESMFEGSAFSIEYRIVDRNGEIRWISETGVGTRAGRGRPAFLDGYLCDVTPTKRARRALEEAEYRLRRSEELSKVMVIHMSPEGRWLRVPPFFARLLQFQKEDFAFLTCQNLLHADDAEAFWSHCKTERGSGGNASFQIDCRFLRKDGAPVWLEIYGSRMRDDRGEVTSIVLHARDVTERRATEAALRESETRFLDIARVAEEFFWETDEDGRFTFVSEGLERLLGIPRFEIVGRTLFNTAALTPINGTRKHFHGLMTRALPLENWEFEGRAPDGQSHLLVWNGIPVIDSNGNVHGYRGVGRLLRDSDNTSADQPSAGEAAPHPSGKDFEALRAKVRHDGNNFLSIAHGYLSSLESPNLSRDGQKRVLEGIQRALGRLSAAVEELKVAQDRPSETGVEDDDTLSRPIILIVDDERGLLDLMVFSLESNGFRVITADCGKEAIRTIEEKGDWIDLVMCDLNLPEVDGQTVISAMKQKNSDTRLVVTSGHLTAEDETALLSLGMDCFLQKPFRLDSVISKLTELVSGTRKAP